jgi:predicted RNA-binding Zn ribbon-like protein
MARDARLGVAVDDLGETALEPADRGVDGAVAVLLGILHEAQLTGAWSRMKGCRQCQYAFFDRSKNRSAAWCAMSICGNRTKNRAYYRRRRSAPG